MTVGWMFLRSAVAVDDSVSLNIRRTMGRARRWKGFPRVRRIGGHDFAASQDRAVFAARRDSLPVLVFKCARWEAFSLRQIMRCLSPHHGHDAFGFSSTRVDKTGDRNARSRNRSEAGDMAELASAIIKMRPISATSAMQETREYFRPSSASYRYTAGKVLGCPTEEWN